METDHLSLIPIFKKLLYLVPVRLQLMMIQMLFHDIKARLRAGKDIPVLDTLSEQSVSDTCPSLSETLDVQVNMVISSLPVRLQTEQDEQLSVLKQVILDGWPVYRKK